MGIIMIYELEEFLRYWFLCFPLVVLLIYVFFLKKRKRIWYFVLCSAVIDIAYLITSSIGDSDGWWFLGIPIVIGKIILLSAIVFIMRVYSSD